MKQQEKSLLDPSLRRVIHCVDREMKPYDRYGEPRQDMEWLHLSGQADNGFECFLLRLKPGASTTPHEHSGHEQFLMLHGELVDCDGTVFKEGDFVTFEPGSRHCSRSENGCTMLVMLRGQNYAIDLSKMDAG